MMAVEFQDFRMLLNKARDMRAMQRAYFKTRNKQCLDEAKRLEKELDEMLSDLIRKYHLSWKS